MLAVTTEEIHQFFVPFRCACLGDWMINMSGISCFLVGGWLLIYLPWGSLLRHLSGPIHDDQLANAD